MAIALRNSRVRRRLTQAVAGLTGGGAVTGAAIAYFFDPQNGKRRRHMARERTAALVRGPAKRAAQGARGGATLAREKAVGLTHEARNSLNGAQKGKQGVAKGAATTKKSGATSAKTEGAKAAEKTPAGA